MQTNFLILNNLKSFSNPTGTAKQRSTRVQGEGAEAQAEQTNPGARGQRTAPAEAGRRRAVRARVSR